MFTLYHSNLISVVLNNYLSTAIYNVNLQVTVYKLTLKVIVRIIQTPA